MNITKQLCITNADAFLKDPSYNTAVFVTYSIGSDLPAGWINVCEVEIEVHDESLTAEALLPKMIAVLDSDEEKLRNEYYRMLDGIQTKRQELMAITYQVDK